jgi:hypothetical protein
VFVHAEGVSNQHNIVNLEVRVFRVSLYVVREAGVLFCLPRRTKEQWRPDPFGMRYFQGADKDEALKISPVAWSRHRPGLLSSVTRPVKHKWLLWNDLTITSSIVLIGLGSK